MSGIKRLLCIVGKMSADGAETFLMKIYRMLDKQKYQMDFCVTTVEKGFYDDEIERLGGRMFRVPPKTKGVFKNFVAIKRLVKDNHYLYVIRISQHSLSGMELLAAKFGGAKVLAFRSSNTNTCGGRTSMLLHRLFKFLPKHIANVRIAPSTESAVFMFGKRYVEKGKCIILQNGLNIDDYCYSEKNRKRIRKELSISDDCFVIGNIGRLTEQKNHVFLLEVFKHVLLSNPNSKLVLVGEGELRNELESLAEQLGIVDQVIFTGVRSDIGSILSCFDVFVFTSFFEGMPNVLIEAQANGVPCIVSDSITKEVDITNSVAFLPLSSNVALWTKRITSSKRNTDLNIERCFIQSKYDLGSTVSAFCSSIFEKKC